NARQRASRQNQTAIRGAREGRDSVLDVADIVHVDRAHLHPKRRRRRLDGAPLADPAGYGGGGEDRHTGDAPRRPPDARPPTPAAVCLASSTHFALVAYSNRMKPVALPPGRARLLTKPAPTGSGTCTNTIGTVRVACNNGPTVKLPGARMTSGASAINSAAYL